MVFYAAFNSISVISRRQLTLFMLSWVSPVLGWALKCLAQGHSHEQNPEDPVRLEPRTPGLRVKHFTTEPRRTLYILLKSKTVSDIYICIRYYESPCILIPAIFIFGSICHLKFGLPNLNFIRKSIKFIDWLNPTASMTHVYLGPYSPAIL